MSTWGLVVVTYLFGSGKLNLQRNLQQFVCWLWLVLNLNNRSSYIYAMTSMTTTVY